MTNRGRIERLFAGRWAETGCGAPMLWPGDRVLVARRALDQADLWPCPDPRHIAAELGFLVCACRVYDCGGETTDGQTIFYRWHPDRRERGLLLAHGIAHAILMREGWAHSETDAWWVTADLVTAGALSTMTLERVIREAHAPEWFIRAFAAVSRPDVAPLRAQVRRCR